MSPSSDRFAPSATLLKAVRNVAILCGLVFLSGLLAGPDPERLWGGYLMGFQLFVGLGLAGGVFLSIYFLSGARWGAALRRIPEALLGTLPFAGVLGLILLMGVPSLYEWSHSGAVDESPLLAHKAPWLNVPFFCIRTVLYFTLWIWCGRRLLATARAQDADRERADTGRNVRNGALFMAVFAVTFSLASIDWIQSLEPEWFSTMFGLVTASGVVCSGLAVLMITAVLMRRSRLAPGVISRNHLDDLGKLAMAFSLFWIYIWFCQYMLIWYTNMPEETVYYTVRETGAWAVLTPVNIALNFLVPFLVLMPKAWRRRGSVLLRVAIIMLVGRVVDLYLLIFPALSPDAPRFGVWELAPLVGCLALFAWIYLHKLAEQPLVSRTDPWIEQSLTYHC